MKYSAIGRGYAALDAGAWVGDLQLPLFEGVRLKVARVWNAAFSALHTRLSAEAEAANLVLAGSGKSDQEIFDACLVECTLLDWEGFDETYTADIGRLLLADKEAWPVFSRAIILANAKLEAVVKEQLEADEKN